MIPVIWAFGNFLLGFVVEVGGIWRQTALPFLYFAEVIITTVLMIRWQKTVAPPLPLTLNRITIVLWSWLIVPYALMVVASSFYPVVGWYPVGLSHEEFYRVTMQRSIIRVLIMVAYGIVVAGGLICFALRHYLKTEKAKKREGQENPAVQP